MSGEFHVLVGVSRRVARYAFAGFMATLAAGDLISLNKSELRGGQLLDNISGVFGANAFLSCDDVQSGETVAQALKAALQAQLARAVDLFHEWDAK